MSLWRQRSLWQLPSLLLDVPVAWWSTVILRVISSVGSSICPSDATRCRSGCPIWAFLTDFRPSGGSILVQVSLHYSDITPGKIIKAIPVTKRGTVQLILALQWCSWVPFEFSYDSNTCHVASGVLFWCTHIDQSGMLLGWVTTPCT